MYRMTARWFSIWSMATYAKLTVINSGTGRRPVIAAPVAMPMIAASEIGVSNMRFSPNCSRSPRVTLNDPS